MGASRVAGTRQQVAEWLFSLPQDAVVEARVRRRSRTLTQNAYYWALLNQLAAALRVGEPELHRQMLRDYGPHEVFSVRSDVPVEGYFRYFDEVGRGTVGGREFRHIRAYKGSSEMDCAEFARLLDGAIAECEQQGVPTIGAQAALALEFAGGAR